MQLSISWVDYGWPPATAMNCDRNNHIIPYQCCVSRGLSRGCCSSGLQKSKGLTYRSLGLIIGKGRGSQATLALQGCWSGDGLIGERAGVPCCSGANWQWARFPSYNSQLSFFCIMTFSGTATECSVQHVVVHTHPNYTLLGSRVVQTLIMYVHN